MIRPSGFYYRDALALLKALGIDPTETNVTLVVAWEWHEWGSTTDLLITQNMLANSLPVPGSYDWNSVGVQVYPTVAAGAAANAQTLQQKSPSYQTLVAGLRNSAVNTFFGSVGSHELAVWAGGPAAPDYSYPRDLYTIYTELQPVPTQYLSVTTPAKNPPPVGPLPQPGSSAGLVAGTIALAGFGLIGVSLYSSRRSSRR